MANIKSQIKRNITNEKRRMMNASFRTRLKSAIKTVENAVENNEADKAKDALQRAYKMIDRAVGKGLYHKNKAARKKSRLSKKVNDIV